MKLVVRFNYYFFLHHIFFPFFSERKRPGTRTLLNPTPNIVHPVIPSGTDNQTSDNPIRNQPKQNGIDLAGNTDGVNIFSFPSFYYLFQQWSYKEFKYLNILFLSSYIVISFFKTCHRILLYFKVFLQKWCKEHFKEWRG